MSMRPSENLITKKHVTQMEAKMKFIIVLSALLVTGFLAASTEKASAVYCQYIEYPAGCVARPGVALRARPIARGAVTQGTAVNRGGPVNRAGRR
jgi:hypothetical protein